MDKVIPKHVTETRAANEAEFVTLAVRLYGEAVDAEEAEIIAAADEGAADIDAGRFEMISNADDFLRLRAELGAMLYRLEKTSLT